MSTSSRTSVRHRAAPTDAPGQRYLDAARAVLERDGSEGVTMRAVAEVAGTSATAIYRFFPDKEALLDAVYGQLLDDFRATIESTARQEGPTTRARLLRVLEAYRDFGLDDPEGYSLLFIEPNPARRSRYPDDFRTPRSSTFRLFVEAIEACIAEGTVRDGDPVDIALALDAQVTGLIVLFRSGRFGDEVDEFRRFFRVALERALD